MTTTVKMTKVCNDDGNDNDGDNDEDDEDGDDNDGDNDEDDDGEPDEGAAWRRRRATTYSSTTSR